MREIKLKPCPFCGGEVKLDHAYNEFYMVRCDNCCSVTTFGYTYKGGMARDATRVETVKAWNRRAVQ